MVLLAVSPIFPLDKYTMTGGNSGPDVLSNFLWKKLDLGSTWGLMSRIYLTSGEKKLEKSLEKQDPVRTGQGNEQAKPFHLFFQLAACLSGQARNLHSPSLSFSGNTPLYQRKHWCRVCEGKFKALCNGAALKLRATQKNRGLKCTAKGGLAHRLKCNSIFWTLS